MQYVPSESRIVMSTNIRWGLCPSSFEISSIVYPCLSIRTFICVSSEIYANGNASLAICAIASCACDFPFAISVPFRIRVGFVFSHMHYIDSIEKFSAIQENMARRVNIFCRYLLKTHNSSAIISVDGELSYRIPEQAFASNASGKAPVCKCDCIVIAAYRRLPRHAIQKRKGQLEWQLRRYSSSRTSNRSPPR